MGLIFSTATVGRVADGNEGSALFTRGSELWSLKTDIAFMNMYVPAGYGVGYS